MYRNCAQRKACNLNNQCTDKNNTDFIDDTCKNVSSNLGMLDECECGFEERKNVFPENPMYAQSYVPWQTMEKTFVPSVGLKMGTIFPELVSPYMPGQSMEEIEYIRNTNNIGEGCNK